MPQRIIARFALLSLIGLSAACGMFRGDADIMDEQVVTAQAPAPEPVRESRPRTQPAVAVPAVIEYDAGVAAVPLRPGAPERYTVKRGDTLWDISGLFLDDPWLWPEIWYVNPQIDNPHLIYPGDVLRLVWVDGRPQIRLERDGVSADARLSPQVRYESLDDAISTIPYELIAAFLSRPSIFDKKTIKTLPYILDIRESHLVAGSGFHVYVRGTDATVGTQFQIYHIGKPLHDPDTGKMLGYEGVYVGEGRITSTGDPSTMFLTDTTREALIGDRLVLEDPSLPVNFFPSAPASEIDARILSVVDGVSLIGAYQIVTLNVGAVDGIVVGNVLSVYQTGDVIHDRVASTQGIRGLFSSRKVKLPDEYAGELMIFRVLDELSFGLVMRATSEIKVLDAARNPI